MMSRMLERYVGAPATLEELKHKPGRRLTLRASGPERSAIVKLYRSDRVLTVAARLAALSTGPPEPEIPEVLAVDPDSRMIVLSEVRGTPLREAVLALDEVECRRAGSLIASWHVSWYGRVPPALPVHDIRVELDALLDWARLAPREIGSRVVEQLPELRQEWIPATVVHRDLYEEQVLLGARVGLIDLDDAAAGPPELDIGNLLAHLDLLELRAGKELSTAAHALLVGYLERGPLDEALLDRCRRLTRLRLACIHSEPLLLEPSPTLTAASS